MGTSERPSLASFVSSTSGETPCLGTVQVTVERSSRLEGLKKRGPCFVFF